ncbi:redoxin family protein, partial [Myxococcota bacterium]|nr:redoxin family protein [Myxococcota bacterium]
TAARDRATAFVCQGSACLVPTQEPADLAEQLEDAASPSPTRQAQPLREAAPPLPQEPERWLNSPLPLSLEQLRGRVVVLDFWSSCCINCQHVLPELAAVEARLAGQPFAVIGVHSGKFPAEREASTVRRAIRRLRIPHPVIHDPDHALWKAFGVQAWPTVIVLDALGRIAWRHAGEVRREELLAVVDGLLDEARQAGLPAPARLPATTTTLEDSLLDHPGKMHLYPDAAAQEMGADPFGPQARLYVADTGHHRVVECRVERGPDGWPAAHVERVFGSGTGGLLDARAPLARFQDPQGLARAGDSLWVADTGNHALRRIDLSTGQVSTVAGTGRLAAGPAQAQRRPLQTELRSPWDVAVAGADAGMPGAPQGPDVVFVAMAGMHQVWVYLAEHDELGPFLGSGREDHVDGAPQEAALAQPSGLCLFGRYIFLVDSETSSVRAFDLAEREVGTVVGRGLFDFGDVDGPPDQVRLQHPLGLTLADGELYVADTFNGKIKVISLQGGHTRTLCGAEGELCEPGGVAVAGEFLLVADTGNHELKVVHRRTGELRRLPLR